MLTFFLIVLVVWLHAYSIHPSAVRKGPNLFVQLFISQGLARAAVPLFFLISGYLFFRKMGKGGRAVFAAKIGKRTRTLLLPYVVWAVYGIALYAALQMLPPLRSSFSNWMISDYSLPKLVKTIAITPIPGQLWFLRDLYVMTLMSPAVYLLIRGQGC